MSPTPRLGVDDPLPAHLVVGVHQRAQVGERVLDLAPVVELHAPDHPVRDAGPHQRLLDDAALRVGPVEDREVGEAGSLGLGQPGDLVDDERRLVALVLGLVAGDELATDLVGPEVLGVAAHVVGDHRVGGVEDRLGGAVVLVEHHDRRLGERLLEAHQVAVVGAAEAEDRLVLVADRHQVAVPLRQHADDLPLGGVRVLELVDEDVVEAAPPAVQDVGVLAEQLHRQRQQVVEVDRGGLEQTALVLRVDVGQGVLRRGARVRHRLLGADEVVLEGRDPGVELAGGYRFGSRFRSRRT